LVDHLIGQPDLAALVEASSLTFTLFAFLDDVGGLLHAVRGELADVNEPIPGAKKHEGAEIHGLDDGALVDVPISGIGRDRLDPVDRGLIDSASGGRTFTYVVLDVLILAPVFSTISRESPCRRCRSLRGFLSIGILKVSDARRVFAGGELGACRCQRLGHLAKDVQPGALGLVHPPS